jgi:hypothetical protein
MTADEDTRRLLGDMRRDIDDAVVEIGQAVEQLEAGEPTSAEALLGEATTRLKLLGQRIDDALRGPA